MSKMTAYCGLVCSDCPSFIATRNDDDEARAKTAAFYRKTYGFDLQPEEINCDGCLATDGRHIGYCAMGEIRKCGMEHAVENCAHCADFECEKLKKFLDQVPAARAKLEGVRKGLA